MPQWFSWPEDVKPPTTFEIVWGFVIPLFALIFDPFVFRDQTTMSGPGGPGLFEAYRVGGYLALGGSILAFAIIVLRPPHRPELQTLASGLLWGAAAISVGFGLALAPFSLIGLIFVIGILGVIPFLAGLAYARVARRLLRVGLPRWYRRWQFWLGLLLLLLIPLGAQFYATRRIDAANQALIAGPPAKHAGAIAALRSAFWCSASCYDPLAWAYGVEPDPARKQALSSAYEEITGGSIQDRLRRMYSD
jgi:hypothetical protein